MFTDKKDLNWKAADLLFEEAINDLVHKNVLEKEKRPDGRQLDELRALSGEVGLVLSDARIGLIHARQYAGACHNDARCAGSRTAYRNDGNDR